MIIKKEDFFFSVYAVVRLIPEGRVTSYGAIARYLGSPKSSRVVGYAMNASHQYTDIPAHRVVNRIGLLTGRVHFSPPESMEEKLVAEKIIVKNHQIQNFDKVFWDPLIELADDLDVDYN